MKLRNLCSSLAGSPTTAASTGATAAHASLGQELIQDRAKFLTFSGLVLQLGLLTLLFRQFQLENPAFYQNIALIVLGGFILQPLVPTRLHLAFFLLLSLLAIGSIFGLVNSVWLLAIGLGLIALCHLPVSFGWRVVALLGVGGLLVALRADFIHAPWSAALWPILGSMFMFRLIVYLYDIQHDQTPFSLSRTLSYFFLLPNVVFPLFPVVDYSTFRRTYRNDDPLRIYQRGMNWIWRGTLQLILYRIVYYYLIVSPTEISNLNDLTRFIVANFLLYLRVSGDFHLIVGILLLFGFNLPETHHRYLLASSFTDFWRRINIYWKDFMMKLCFYPSYFRLKKHSTLTALVLATLFVFLMTWFLHAYQWFWILGDFLLAPEDMLFWAILAVLLVGNSIYEFKRPKRATLGTPKLTPRELVMIGLRTSGTFIVIAVLWSMWTSESFSEWILAFSVLKTSTPGEYLQLLALILGGIAFVALFEWGSNSLSANKTTSRFLKNGSVLLNIAAMGLLLAVSWSGVNTRLGFEARNIITRVREADFNRQDAIQLQRGYYENLLGVNRLNSQLWEVYLQRPPDLPHLWQVGGAQLTDTFLAIELNPSVAITFNNKPFTTNEWGMRDAPYAKTKPPNTYRVALLGASNLMGWGVADNETFESLMEKRLTGASTPQTRRYEFLNFGVESYSLLQDLAVLDQKALAFHPDALYLFVNSDEGFWVTYFLANTIRQGKPMPYPYLTELAARTGIDARTSRAEAESRLAPYTDQVLSWTLRTIAEKARANGIRPVLVYLLNPGPNPPETYNAKLLKEAEQDGLTVIDLADLFQAQDAATYRVAPWDFHPNAAGHERIADRLLQELRARNLLPLVESGSK